MTGKLAPRVDFRQRISTQLFAVLACIAALIGLGLLLVTIRLFDIRSELDELRSQSLPILIRLSQLSQDASATSSIVPTLSQALTRSENDTLIARIQDKQASQKVLINELEKLSSDPERVATLGLSVELLSLNLDRIKDAVEGQIDDRRILEAQAGRFARILSDLREKDQFAEQTTIDLASRTVSQIDRLLQDANRARFARNRVSADASIMALNDHLAKTEPTPKIHTIKGAAYDLITNWTASRPDILATKSSQLANAFQIRALVEENSLIANRLLSSASNEFWRASTNLEAQVKLVNETTRFTLIVVFAIIVAMAAGAFLVFRTLRNRVLLRLDRLRDALRRFAEDRQHGFSDDRPDEIGEISDAMAHYMAVIDQRETELGQKTKALERLANQLAKYLSPQVYDSIFTGRQEVKLASSRKKLTIFFSDIVEFTETADRLESEELTQLLNHYLTEMSQIAFRHGATIDKYVGDAILIFFGDPESRGVREDALACVRMAMDMRKRMTELQGQWRSSGIEKPLQIRIGIHTGYCTVGNFGSEDRLDYTIIGGAVNIASRLEAMAAPGSILISYETFALVEDHVACSEQGAIDVKGIAYPVVTYRVFDDQHIPFQTMQQLHEQYAHFSLDMDLSSMSEKDRQSATQSLRNAIRLLESRDPDSSAPQVRNSPYSSHSTGRTKRRGNREPD